jgi:hypothetical protein
MIRIRLSSISTVFYKVFTAILIGTFGLGAILLLAVGVVSGLTPRGDWIMGIMVLFVFTAASGVILWLALRLQTVWLEGDCLIVRNYRTEVSIPLADVRYISETRMCNPKMIKLQIRSTPGIPGEVVFIAKWTLQFPFSDHPTVKELQSLVDKARAKAGKNSSPPPRITPADRPF